MLTLISFDAVSRPLLDRMIAEGRLPHCAKLRHRGKTYDMEPTPFHASVYRSLYTGLMLSTHGVHYPFQWRAAEQRVRPVTPMRQEDSIFARLDRAGRRMLVIDPPECGPFELRSGLALSGWQFTTRFVLPEWSSSRRVSRALKAEFGSPKSCHEVFGRPSMSRLRAMRSILRAAPRRLADATVACLKNEKFDLVWVTFVGAHIAGHQLWPAPVDSTPGGHHRDGEALAEIYQGVDEALGHILAALPPRADVILFSANGMGPETSRADLLPAMLARVLEGSPTTRATHPPAGPLWRLRAAIPAGIRARVADAIPDRLTPRLTARLETAWTNWKTTRAFAPPSDGAGFVRFNLKGRERDGIVDLGDSEALCEEITAGLETFVEPTGGRAVTSVVRSADLVGPGPQSGALPDLVVLWPEQPAGGLGSVTSPRFGEVLREGVGSGRSGNHCDGTWATVVPNTARSFAPGVAPIRVVDLTATVCALLGVGHGDLPGRPLIK